MFKCEFCVYSTDRKFDFNRHLGSNRHLKNIETKKYRCNICKKTYTTERSLLRHEKTHFNESTLLNEIIRDNQEIKREMIKHHQALIEMLPHHTINTVNNTINNIQNINNNHLSINVFLNEKCKNAINLSDFIESIQITDEDIQQCPNNGLIKNISNSIINALKQLDYYERPIHCSDRKRSTLYIKDNDKWDKDNEHNHMRGVIDNVSFKHFMKLKEWVTSHPNYVEDDNLRSEYMSMVGNITSDLSNKNNKPYKKIIQQVGNETYVSGINNVTKIID
jgi:hypothetical protein